MTLCAVALKAKGLGKKATKKKLLKIKNNSPPHLLNSFKTKLRGLLTFGKGTLWRAVSVVPQKKTSIFCAKLSCSLESAAAEKNESSKMSATKQEKSGVLCQNHACIHVWVTLTLTHIRYGLWIPKWGIILCTMQKLCANMRTESRVISTSKTQAFLQCGCCHHKNGAVTKVTIFSKLSSKLA